MEKKELSLKEVETYKYRSNLFGLQFVFTLVLVAIGAMFLYSDNYFTADLKWLRVILAPAIAGSFLVFLFFLCLEGMHNLTSEYVAKEVTKAVLLVATVGVVICVSCDLLLSHHLERTVALVSVYLGVCFFFLMRYRNLWTMAIITGVVEGLLLYFVFVYGTTFSLLKLIS